MVLSCAISLLTIRVGSENKLEAYKKLLREKGEKLEISEVAPPPVPAGENCADAVKLAFGSIGMANVKVPGEMRMVAPGKAMVGWMQPMASNTDFTNAWEDLAAEGATFRPIIETLKQVFERPKLDFGLDYKKGFSLLLPQLASSKRAAQILTSEAALDLHNGDTGAAATNIRVLLALVHGNHDEAIAISHLVRIAEVAIAEGATWELLQATNATDQQLAELQREWEQLEFIDSAEKAFLMERAMMKSQIEKARVSSAQFDCVFSGYSGRHVSGGGSSSPSSSWPANLNEFVDDAKLASGKFMWRTSWNYSEEIHLLQADQIVLEALRTMKTNQVLKPQSDAMKARLDTIGLTNVGEPFFDALDIPDFRDIFTSEYMGSTVIKTLRTEASRRVVVAAVALKRFQLKHGKWPESLEELVPEFFPAVPIDPYDGKPLRYHPNADGTYLLYCVGPDGVDDGGAPANISSSTGSVRYDWQNSKAQDWVWPQPATEAEIKFFYDNPPK